MKILTNMQKINKNKYRLADKNIFNSDLADQIFGETFFCNQKNLVNVHDIYSKFWSFSNNNSEIRTYFLLNIVRRIVIDIWSNAECYAIFVHSENIL